MTRLSLMVLAISVFPILCKAQVNGDYRSVASGDWSVRTNWERFNGGVWSAPSVGQGYPGFSSTPTTVTVREDQNIALDVTPVNNLNDLILEGTSDLDFDGVDFTVSNNSSLTLNGTLTIGDFFAAMTFSGSGSLTAGNITVGFFSTFTLSTSGNMTVNGIFTNDGTFTDNNNTGITTFMDAVNTIGSWTTTAVATSSNLIFRGGITYDPALGGLTPFNAAGATFDTNNQSINGSETLNFNRTVVVTGVSVTNNATVNITNTGAGRLSGTGTWIQGLNSDLNYASASITINTFSTDNTGNTVTYNSSVAQTIETPSAGYYNLAVSNSSATIPQLTLAAGSFTVSNALTMTDGVIDLNSNTITLGTAPGTPGTLSHAGNAANGWMYNGSFIRFFSTGTIPNGNVRGFFPLGNATDFRPFYISCPATGIATGGSLTVNHDLAITTNDVSIADSGPVTISRQYQGFWDMQSSGIAGGTYNIVAGGTGFGTIGSTTHLRLHKTSTAIGTHVAATGSTADPRLQRTGLSLAQLVSTGGSQWYLGSTDNINSPLPIVLTYFAASIENDQVITEWQTAREIDNDFFTIEKTIDFEKFYQVGMIDGRGSTSESHSYSLTDNAPFIGKSYYRLKQTDFDGKFSYSEPVPVDYEGPTSLILQAYPNPFNGRQIHVELKGLKDRPEVPLIIYNHHGQLIFETTLTETGPGVINKELYFSTQLPQGLYVIKAGRTQQLTRKISVN